MSNDGEGGVFRSHEEHEIEMAREESFNKEMEKEPLGNCAHCGDLIDSEIHSAIPDQKPFYCSETCYGKRK